MFFPAAVYIWSMDEEGMRLKRCCAALLAALMLGICAPGAAAQTQIAVYIAEDGLPEGTALQLVQLLQRAIPEAAFLSVSEAETGLSLRELVMRDEAPQLALCPVQEAAVWADEGLLLPLDTSLGDTQRIAPAVLAACFRDDYACMIPLLARHRQVAVNRALLAEMGLEHMLDLREYPVWLPIQLEQVLEEAALCGLTGMELWPLVPQESDGILAMAQAMYAGPFLSEDGALCLADSTAAAAGVEWLGGMTGSGLIAMAESREKALQNFLAGKSVLFADWTPEDAAAVRGKGIEAQVATMPYPSSSGLPVRAFEVIGAAAFSTGDQRTDAIARAAAAVLMEDAQAQRLLGERGIFEDGAIWLPCIETGTHPAALRGALCASVGHVLAGEMQPEAAMRAVSAAVRAH